MLKGLRVREVSGVDRAANPGAAVLLWKRDESPPDTTEIPAGDGVITEAGPPPVSVISNHPAAGDGNDEDKSMADATLEARVADLEAALRAKDDKLVQVEAEKATAEQKAAEATAQVETAKAEAQKVTKAEADRIAKVERQLEEVVKTNADLAKAHSEAVEKAERLEYIAKAEQMFPFTPGTPEDKGEELRAIEKMGDGPVKERLLKKLREADASFAILTKERGVAGVQKTDDPVQECIAKANALCAANPKLSMAQAMDQAAAEIPGFAKRYEEAA
jgi:hypothetical protein